MFLAGERCDVETLEWAKRSFGVPILDHWWQTGTIPFIPPRRAYEVPERSLPSSPQGLPTQSNESRTRPTAARKRVLFSFIGPSFGVITHDGGAQRLFPRSMNLLCVL